MTSVHIRDTQERETQREGEGHVKMEAETGVMQPQAKECLEPPETRRGEEVSSPRAFRGSTVLSVP